MLWRASRSSRRSVSATTRDGSAGQWSGVSVSTPQMWNHSSTSTVNAFTIRRERSTVFRHEWRDTGLASGMELSLLLDEGGDGIDRAEHFAAGLLVADDHAEGTLEFEHEFQRVNGIEAEALAEQRDFVQDLVRLHRQLQASDEGLF